MVYIQQKTSDDFKKKIQFLFRTVYRQGTKHVMGNRCVKDTCNGPCIHEPHHFVKGVPVGKVISDKETLKIRNISEWSYKGQRVMFMKQCEKNNFFIVSKHSATFRQKLAYYDIICKNELVIWDSLYRLEHNKENKITHRNRRKDNFHGTNHGKVHYFMSTLVDRITNSKEFRTFWKKLSKIYYNKDQYAKNHPIKILCFGFSMGGAISKLLSVILDTKIQAELPGMRVRVLMVSQGGFPVCDEAFLKRHVEKNKSLHWLNMVNVNKITGNNDNVTLLFTPPYANPPSITCDGKLLSKNEMIPNIDISCKLPGALSPFRVYSHIQKIFGQGNHRTCK